MPFRPIARVAAPDDEPVIRTLFKSTAIERIPMEDGVRCCASAQQRLDRPDLHIQLRIFDNGDHMEFEAIRIRDCVRVAVAPCRIELDRLIPPP